MLDTPAIYKLNMKEIRFHRIYRKMRERCSDKNHKYFCNYGGSGIKLFWKTFDQFKKDMYKSYQYHVKKYGEKETTIDRINSNGNYCKENCRWSTYKVQQRNRTNNRIIIYNGKSGCLSKIAEENNLDQKFLLSRINRWNDVKKSIEQPKKKSRLIIYNNNHYTVKELSKIVNIIPETLRYRIDNWGIKKAIKEKVGKYERIIQPSRKNSKRKS